MKKKVYIETSIVSYLTGKPSQNLLVAAWQILTTEWWENRRDAFELYTSELVIEEASRGDMKSAQKRLKALPTGHCRQKLQMMRFILHLQQFIVLTIY